DFQDQLTSQHTSTVSFAMAMPLPPEIPALARVTPPPKSALGSRPPTGPTDILPQQPPQPPPLPTAAIATTELGLADGTGTIDHIDQRHIDASPRRSKRPMVILLAAAVVVGGGLVFAFTRGTGQSAPPAPRPIQVETIPPEEQTPPPKVD